MQDAVQHCLIDGRIRPRPKCAKRFMVGAQQITRERDDGRLADPKGQTIRLHSVLNPQNALFKEFTLHRVGIPGGVLGHCAGLPGEVDIRIARSVCS
jgi:hypothetical protein